MLNGKKGVLQNVNKVLIKIFLALGIIFFIVSLITTANRFVFLSKASASEGEVVNLIKNTSSKTYTPEVRFYTKDGNARVFRSDFSSNPPAFKVGERVKVLYLEDAPDTVMIDSFFSLWLLQLVFLFFGLTFSAISVSNLLKLKKGLPLSRSYNIELSGGELKYILFDRKTCPNCQRELKRKKTTVDIGYGRKSVKYYFVCDNCSKEYLLDDLTSGRQI